MNSRAAADPESPQNAAGDSLLQLRHVSKRFGSRAVIRGVSLGVAAGEFLTLLGESGSGKTTLLRMIAGFDQPTSGEIWMAGERMDSLPPYRRRVNTVFQSYALFPHLSVYENIAYGLRVQGVAKNEIRARVQPLLSLMHLEAHAKSSPSQISGGQAQRVALARALVNRPQVLLLDEPLSALDANMRLEMRAELKSLQREVGITFVFVTHDQEEAMALSDRIALLRHGRLEQVAPPREIYRCPATSYTAQFLGQTNLLRGIVRDGFAQSGVLSWPCNGASGSAIFALRPECIRLADSDAAPSPAGSSEVFFRATIRSQTFGGATDLLEISCADGAILRARLASPGPISGEMTFAFSLHDVVRVRDSEAD